MSPERQVTGNTDPTQSADQHSMFAAALHGLGRIIKLRGHQTPNQTVDVPQQEAPIPERRVWTQDEIPELDYVNDTINSQVATKMQSIREQGQEPKRVDYDQALKDTTEKVLLEHLGVSTLAETADFGEKLADYQEDLDSEEGVTIRRARLADPTVNPVHHPKRREHDKQPHKPRKAPGEREISELDQKRLLNIDKEVGDTIKDRLKDQPSLSSEDFADYSVMVRAEIYRKYFGDSLSDEDVVSIHTTILGIHKKRRQK